MEISFAEASREERGEVLRIWKRVYGAEMFGEDRIDPLPFQRYYLGRVDGEAAVAALVADYPTWVRGELVRCAGVGAVGTLPEHRRGGVGQGMMRRLQEVCRGEGYGLTSLYAFREPFYRKVGYEGCGWRWQIKCPSEQLPLVDGGLRAREVGVEDWEVLDGCYRAFASRLSGCCARTEAHWRRRLGNRPPSLYVVGDPVEGYLWTNPYGFWNDMEIGEMAWTSRRGYESLLALARGLAINKSAVVWCEPPDSPFLARFADSGVEARRHRPTMFGVLDWERVARGAESRLVVDGVGYGSGPEVFGSAGALTQAYLGSPSVDELAGAESLSGPGLERLAAVWPGCPVVCMEFF